MLQYNTFDISFNVGKKNSGAYPESFIINQPFNLNNSAFKREYF